MVSNFIHVIKTYLVSSQYFTKKTLGFIWNVVFICLLVFLYNFLLINLF
jgi:hypothetical protein